MLKCVYIYILYIYIYIYIYINFRQKLVFSDYILVSLILDKLCPLDSPWLSVIVIYIPQAWQKRVGEPDQAQDPQNTPNEICHFLMQNIDDECMVIFHVKIVDINANFTLSVAPDLLNIFH